MTYEQRARYYRRSIDAALAESLEHYDRCNQEDDCPLDDETVIMVSLMTTLRRLADEAEARINMKAQLTELLK